MGILDAPAIAIDLIGRKLKDLDLLNPLARTISVPVGLGFASGYTPTITITQLPGTARMLGTSSLTPQGAFNAVSTALTAPGATYYVDALTGSDSTGTGTNNNPFKSIGKAVAAANTGGVPTLIYVVASATYFRANNPSFNNGTGNVFPTVDIAFVAVGGRVNTGTFDSFTTPGSADATFTNCYTLSVTAATVNRVVDTRARTADGFYTELVNVSTAALCNATPNSWAHVSGTLYINRADKAAPSVSNTRYYRSSSSCFKVTASTVNIYIGGASGNDGFDCEGGDQNAVLAAVLTSSATSDHVLAVSNSTFRYSGGLIDNTVGRGVSLDSWRGLAIFSNCAADASLTDGFNGHNTRGVSNCHGITINCDGIDNGRSGQQSCQGLTVHEDVHWIDIGGRYIRNRGGTIRNINTSKMLLAGTLIDTDLGDYLLGGGGVITSTGVRGDDTAEIWCDTVRNLQPAGGYAYHAAAAGVKIHKRNCWPTRQPDSGPGTVDTY